MNSCTAATHSEINATAGLDRHFSRLISPLPGFVLSHTGNQPAYSEGCRFVADCFQKQFGASVSSFMPYLMTMQCLEKVSAVVGMRPAVIRGTEQSLFLEQYLDDPADVALGRLMQTSVERSGLVEVGNLVSLQRGASQLLFLLMTSTLRLANREWVVFTATKTLRKTLEHLDFPAFELGRASQSRLSEQQQLQWGAYYQTEPYVMAGRLDAVDDIITRKPLLRGALRVYEGAISDMAAILPQN